MRKTVSVSRDEIIDALEKVAENGVPPPGAAYLLDVGTSTYVGYIENEIVHDLLGGGGATFRVYEGPYGAGKTHLLQLLGDLGLRSGMALARTDLSQSLGLETPDKLTKYILQRIQVRIDGQIATSLPSLLLALRGAAREMTTALASAALPHPGFKAAMCHILTGQFKTDESVVLLTRYLQGDRVRVRDLRQAEIPNVKDPLSQRNAEQVLTTVLGGLHLLAIPGTMLLFDENEQTLSLEGSSKTRSAANLMRRLIDACANGALPGTMAAFAVLPGFLDRCSRSYPALGQRLQMPRDGDIEPSWRWPVLALEHVTSVTSQEEFLALVVEKFCTLAETCGIDNLSLAELLRSHGEQIMLRNAGSGYRRELVKLLAATTLKMIEDYE